MSFSTRRLTRFFILGTTLLIWPLIVGAIPTRNAAASSCDPATACFDASLFPATLFGDFYLDGNLVASSVNSARLTGTPGATHTIEVRNIQDPATPGFNDLFIYSDQSRSNQLANAGQIRFSYFYPVKTYVKGALDFTCNPRGRKTTDNVACRLTLDGVMQPDVAPNVKVTYNLLPGTHNLHTELVGDQANNWSPTSRDDTVTISAGRSFLQTARLFATFTLKGLFKINVLPKGLLADLYVDGALIVSQSTSVDLFVAPGTHTVEARAVTDPKANGLYVYGDLSQSVFAYAAGTRFVNLYPKKTWLLGFLSLTCSLLGKTASDDVHCVVSSDGAPLGTVTAGERATFNLPTGAHNISVATGGASAGKWSGSVNTTLTIYGGQTSYYTARFKILPATAVPTATQVPTTTQVPTITQDLILYFYFGAEGCPYSRRMAPTIERFYQQYVVNASLTNGHHRLAAWSHRREIVRDISVSKPYRQYSILGLPPLQGTSSRLEVQGVPVWWWGGDPDVFRSATGVTFPFVDEPWLDVDTSRIPVTVVYNKQTGIYRTATIGVVSYSTLVDRVNAFAAGENRSAASGSS